MKTKRNGEIDLLRFLFSLVIVLMHFNSVYDFGVFPQGSIVVEFFFILSGYLMAQHVERKQSERRLTSAEVADMTWKYIIKKIGSFFSYYVFVIILQVVVRSILIQHKDILSVIIDFFRSIPTFSLTFMGLNYSSVSLYVGNTWYLSAMILAMFILYPMLLRYYHLFSKLIFPIAAVFIIGYLQNTYNTITNWNTWTGLVYAGTLRAVAEIALGASLRPLSAYLRQAFSWLINSNKFPIKILLTAFKAGCYLVVFAYAYGFRFGGNFTLHAMLFCALGILLSFTGVGYSIPDCKLTRYCGKIALPIYIFHGFIRWTCHDIIPPSAVNFATFMIIVASALIASVLLMYITDFSKKLLCRLFSRIKQCC